MIVKPDILIRGSEVEHLSERALQNQLARVKKIHQLAPGTIFRKPGQLVTYRKLDRGAVRSGWHWMRWVTDGRINRLMDTMTLVFVIREPEEEEHA